MKILKNRTVLGAVCIAVSLLLCFAVTPLINSGLARKTTVVRFTRAAKEGEVITRDMIEETEVGNYNLPAQVLRSMEEAEGKYLTADVYPGDYILPQKVSEEPEAENRYLYSLSGEKQAMSITISSFAQGLSGKLRSGDIVSVIAPDFLGTGETVIPAELKYVEVIAVTANSGNDANTEDHTEGEKELPSTVTVLVRPEQSRLLARLEAEGEIHLSLVYRGTAEQAEVFIKAQDDVLAELKTDEADSSGEEEASIERKELPTTGGNTETETVTEDIQESADEADKAGGAGTDGSVREGGPESTGREE